MPIREILRNYCPNIPALRRFISRTRIKALDAKLLQEKEIRLGETDINERSRIVASFAEQHKKYAEQTDQRIEELLNKAPVYQNRKNNEYLKTQMRFYRFAYGFQPEEYLCFGLEGKTNLEASEFISDMDRIRYNCQMSDMADQKVFQDKAKTYGKYKPFYNRDVVAISGKRDRTAFDQFVEKHRRFILKEVYSSIGRGISLIDLNDPTVSRDELFNSILAHGKVVLEEIVIQSKDLASFNSTSVNTVRCITLNTRKGVQILCCVLRVGREGHFVDNAGFGGLFAGIDNDTGIVDTDAHSKLDEVMTTHPDTGVPFRGFQLPEWGSMIGICKQMAEMSPTVRFIGWDMAHTDQGWVVIEGNNCPQVGMIQICRKHGLKPSLLKYMEDMDLLVD